MDESFKQLQERLNRGWAGMLRAGKEDLGNLEVNKRFLSDLNLISADSRVLETGCGTG